MATKIEWADETWNPITGCTPISEGCANCYAQRMAKRLAGRFGYPVGDPFRVTVHPDRLGQPLRWRKPRRVFVCSMSDLFHDDVPPKFIDWIFAVMSLCPQHVFMVLTKRPQQALSYVNSAVQKVLDVRCRANNGDSGTIAWPLPNVWLGVTAENQEQVDKRIPILLQTPAAVRFVSVEPMLGAVDLSNHAPFCWKPMTDEEMAAVRQTYPFGLPANSLNAKLERMRLDWVICGGETGPGARPMHPDWARSLRDQCRDAGVPFFFKQWGEWRKANSFGDCYGYKFVDVLGSYFIRVGKKAAGRVLDGVEHNAMPEYHND